MSKPTVPSQPLAFRLCPRCSRAVPTSTEERFCINDGTPMLEGCPHCGVAIRNPYARFCSSCGQEFVLMLGVRPSA